MKAIGLGVFCSLLLATGCFPQHLAGDKGQQAKRDGPPAPRQVRYVTPDEVNERNARQQLQALQHELETARGELPPAPLSDGGPGGRAGQ